MVNDQLTPLTFPEANISNLTDNPTASVLARAQDGEKEILHNSIEILHSVLVCIL